MWEATKPRLRLGLALGLFAGGLEVALRADGQHGLSVGALLQWWLIGVAMSTLLAVAVALLWRWQVRPIGAVWMVLLTVHGALVYRYTMVLNHSLRDPLVWGGVLGVTLAAAVCGWLAQRWLVSRGPSWTRWALGLGLLTLPAALWASRPDLPATKAGGPNVILLTLDTVRPDRLGAYGADNATPTIDALAAGGARFQTAVSTAPLTQPSHLSILSGQPPHISGVVANGTFIGDRPGMLQRVLRDRGYRTAGFVGGFPLHSRFGWSQGMEVYGDDFGDVPGLHRLNLVRAWDLVTQRSHTLRERRAQSVVQDAIEWLDGVEAGPFFLWVHVFDPHAPYEAPGHRFDPPTDGPALDLPAYWPASHRAITSTEWLKRAYDAEIRYVDAQLGRLFAVLQHKGHLKDALVVMTADHGESLTEHGLLFDHGDDLMAPSLRVPLTFTWPGEVAPTTVDCLVSNLDVTPTVLGLLQIQDGHERQGRDLSGVLRGADCADGSVLATTVSGRFVDPPPIDHALRWPGIKRVSHATGESQCWGVPDALDGEEALPDCPGEIANAMDKALSDRAAPAAPQTDAQTTEALRSLGYIE